MNWPSIFFIVMTSFILTGIDAQAVNNPAYLWPNGRVPYEISSQYSEYRKLGFLSFKKLTFANKMK